MSYDSDLDRVRKNAENQGWRYQKTERGHHQFLSPNKEDIVHTSGTPSDQRSWNNFIADMRRAGYKDHPNGVPLGDLVVASRHTGDRETSKDHPAPPSARTILREHLDAHLDETLSAADLSAMVLRKRPEMTAGNVSMALSKMADTGEITRVKMGWYKKSARPSAPDPVPVAPPAPAVAPPPPPDPRVEAATDEDNMEREFDEAVTKMLDAFTTVERLVNKYRGDIRKLAKIKKAMEGL